MDKRQRPSVQVFGRKVRPLLQTVIIYWYIQKTATAVAHCKQGNGIMKVNGKPLHLMEPATLRIKVIAIVLYLSLIHQQLEEPLLLLGKEKFMGVDIRVRVRGGGQVAQIYGMEKILT